MPRPSSARAPARTSTPASSKSWSLYSASSLLGMRVVQADEARRIAVRAQLLDGTVSSVLDTVRRLGYLQIDPISTVAPPQQLVLWSRLGPYDQGELDRLLWVDRKLIEWRAYIWPVESMPYLR